MAAIRDVRACLNDIDGRVRREALQALVQLAERGDVEVVSRVVACLDDGDARVRQAAVNALPLLAIWRDGSARTVVIRRFSDSDGSVSLSNAIIDTIGMFQEGPG